MSEDVTMEMVYEMQLENQKSLFKINLAIEKLKLKVIVIAITVSLITSVTSVFGIKAALKLLEIAL